MGFGEPGLATMLLAVATPKSALRFFCLGEHTLTHQHLNGDQSSNRIHVHRLDGSITGTDSCQRV